MPEPGYIYILMNASLPKFLKIGKTTKPPETRAGELSSGTGIPTPFWVAYKVRVSDCDEAEIRVHNELRKYRVHGDREFFAAPCLQTAIAVLNAVQNLFSFTDEDEVKRRLAEVETKKKLAERQEIEEENRRLQDEFTFQEQGASKGDVLCQYNLGCSYENGLGTSIDVAKALKFYLLAAANGSVDAQFEVGRCYESGIAGSTDLVEAYAFYTIAARKGDQRAITKRKRLAALLAHSELDEARRRISRFIAQAGSVSRSQG